MEELKPCPFCGGEALRQTLCEDEYGNAGGDVIECQSCGASSHVEFEFKENLVSSWNTRTDAIEAATASSIRAAALGAASSACNTVAVESTCGAELEAANACQKLIASLTTADDAAWLAKVKDEVREECAKIAETRWEAWLEGDGFHDRDGLPAVSCDVTACENIAAAIRASKEGK